MATIMHTIYSDTIKGAGLIASGPYGDKHWASEDYGDVNSVNLAYDAINKANQNYADGLIDDTANFVDAPVYIFSGKNDTTYPPTYQKAQDNYYTNYGANI